MGIKRGKKAQDVVIEAVHVRPTGINALIQYSALLAVLYLIGIFTLQKVIFFGFIFSGTVARLVNFILFLMPLAIVYGLAYRQRWVYRFMVFAYVFSIVNSVLSFFSIDALADPYFSSLSGYIIPIQLASIALNCITLWYAYEKKDYILHKHGSDDMVDTVFTRVIHIFYVFLGLFLVLIFTISILSMKSTADGIMEDISQMSFPESQGYCESLDTIEDQDACFVLMVAAFKNEPGVHKLCSSVSTQIYRQVCEKMQDG